MIFQISSTSSSPTLPTISIFQHFQIVQLILFHPLSKLSKSSKAFNTSWRAKTMNAENINKWKCLSTSYGTLINPLKGSVLNPLHPQVQSLDIKRAFNLPYNRAHSNNLKLSFLSSTLSLKDITTGTMRI